jgi:hypothetical protein
MDLKSLLSTSTSTFKAPPRWPAGSYRVIISSYELLPFFWKKSGTHGLSYVPTLKALASIEAEDNDNPELAEEQRQMLESFGDWTAREHQFAYTKKDVQPPTKMAGIAPVNFPLVETDADGSPVGILERQAWRFHMTADQNNGIETGFIHDVLGLEFPNGAPLEELMEATLNKEFIARFEYEANQDPSRPANLVITDVTACV